MRHAFAIATIFVGVGCAATGPDVQYPTVPTASLDDAPKATVTVMLGKENGPTLVLPEPGPDPGVVENEDWEGPLLLTAVRRSDGSFDIEASAFFDGSQRVVGTGRVTYGKPLVIRPDNAKERTFFGGSAQPITLLLQ